MKAEEGIISGVHHDQSHTTNGGDGPHGYTNNSSYQRGAIEESKELIYEVIENKLEIDSCCVDGSKAFGIADLGCSVGQNTFVAVQNIIEAVERVHKSKNQSNSSSTSCCSKLEFQVFFNDNYNNDFNSLFRSSSYASKSYYAAVVAGSFHGRLFPNSSLHFVNCSYALHWISKIPKQVLDKKSPAWNENRIHYTTSSVKQVHEAYGDQHKNDMECFLSARAQEIVGGGLMLIVTPYRPSQYTISQTAQAKNFGFLESCLSEMVKLGHITQDQLDGFNIPFYHPTSEELKAVIEKDGNFNIEKMDVLSRPTKGMKPSVEMMVGTMRALFEQLFRKHNFGDDNIQELFERYQNKLAHNLDVLDSMFRQNESLFIILKRKIN